MSLPRLLLIFAIILFGAIGAIGYFKDGNATKDSPSPRTVAIPLKGEVRVVSATEERPTARATVVAETPAPTTPVNEKRLIPEANRIAEFFNKGTPQLPIVETLVYHSRVPWLKGRPAWLSDYASHFRTSRHFIARSLNGKPEYLKQDISEGDRFNVLKSDTNFEFYLVVDLHRCKMLFYYIDLDNKERVLVKTYDVGLGRLDNSRASGFLTPLGKYSLGDRTATYRPTVKGFYNGEKVELVSVFGSRWIPFDQEIADCTEAAKGLGIHGVPWVQDAKTAQWREDTSSVGRHVGDGCIRLATADIEELFAIIISRPTTVELVRNFYEATPPGKEIARN